MVVLVKRAMLVYQAAMAAVVAMVAMAVVVRVIRRVVVRVAGVAIPSSAVTEEIRQEDAVAMVLAESARNPEAVHRSGSPIRLALAG